MPSFISKLIAWFTRKRAAPEESLITIKELSIDKDIEENHVERVAIFIDGSNFYNFLKTITVKAVGPLGKNKVYSLDGLKERYLFGKGARFDFTLFVDDLSQKRMCVGKSYYTAVFSFNDNESELERVKVARQYFNKMLEHKGFKVRKGVIIKDGDKQYEKGVDTLLTMDVISGAIKDTYDVAIIVSSDNDFLPLFEGVKEYGKKVEYVGFDDQYSLQLRNTADHTVLLTSASLEKYLLK